MEQPPVTVPIHQPTFQRALRPADCPHPVGTVEHLEWIREVCVPSQRNDDTFMRSERQRAGAESLGVRRWSGHFDGVQFLDVWQEYLTGRELIRDT